jgi:hypothetical protein
VTVEVTYELNLEPAEDAVGWTAMVYRSVRAGVCGPWTETKPVPVDPAAPMFRNLPDLIDAGLRVLGLDMEFTCGEPEVYGRFGSIALRVMLVRREEHHMVPTIAKGGGLVWVDAGPVKWS